MAVIFFFGWKIIDILNLSPSSQSPQFEEFRKTLEQDLRNSEKGQITSLTPTSLSIGTSASSIHYEYLENGPYGSIQRNQEALLTNVAAVDFTGLDRNGRYLSESPSEGELSSLEKLEIEIRTHEGKEDSTYYINNRIHGVDLDGDPTNGVARLVTNRVVLRIPR